MLPLRHLGSLGFVSSLFIVGCSPKAEPPARTAAEAKPPAAVVASEVAPALAPVEAPAGVLALARIAHPEGVLREMGNWVGLPLSVTMLDALEPGLARLVEPDASLDAILAVDAESSQPVAPPLGVVSVGIGDLAGTRKMFEQQTGQTMLELGEGRWQSPEAATPHCALSRARGRAAHRLVCGTSKSAVDQLLPYAVRGLPERDLGPSDLVVELYAPPVQKSYLGLVRAGKAMAVPELISVLELRGTPIERPLADLAHALGDELVDVVGDLKQVRITASLARDQQSLELSVTGEFAQTRSFVAGAMSTLGPLAVPAPPQFNQLPAELASASYSVSLPKAETARPRELLLALADAVLATAKSPLRPDAKRLIESWFGMSGVEVASSGPLPSSGEGSRAKELSPFAEMMGWFAMRVQAPSATVVDMLDTLGRLGADPALARLLREGAAVKKPEAAKKGVKSPSRPLFTLRRLTVPKLERGVVVSELELPEELLEEMMVEFEPPKKPGAKDKAAPRRAELLTIAVVPSGNETIVLVTPERSMLEAEIAMLTRPSGPTLGSRVDLTQLRDRPAVSAGFTTLASARGALASLARAAGKPKGLVDSLFNTIPHHGTTPILQSLTVTGSRTAPVVTARVVVPRQVVDDITAAIPTIITLRD